MSRNPGYHPTPGVGTSGINKGCELNRSLCSLIVLGYERPAKFLVDHPVAHGLHGIEIA